MARYAQASNALKLHCLVANISSSGPTKNK